MIGKIHYPSGIGQWGGAKGGSSNGPNLPPHPHPNDEGGGTGGGLGLLLAGAAVVALLKVV